MPADAADVQKCNPFAGDSGEKAAVVVGDGALLDAQRSGKETFADEDDSSVILKPCGCRRF